MTSMVTFWRDRSACPAPSGSGIYTMPERLVDTCSQSRTYVQYQMRDKYISSLSPLNQRYEPMTRDAEYYNLVAHMPYSTSATSAGYPAPGQRNCSIKAMTVDVTYCPARRLGNTV